eukprot:1189520-Prymnesium_polylepis.1
MVHATLALTHHRGCASRDTHDGSSCSVEEEVIRAGPNNLRKARAHAQQVSHAAISVVVLQEWPRRTYVNGPGLPLVVHAA